MVIGVLGGGQLGRMLGLAGLPLGLRFRFLDPSPDAPARDVGTLVVGGFDDPAAIEAFCDGIDVATLEFENVPVEAVRRVEARVPVRPGSRALAVGQDRIAEKNLFVACGVPVHPFAGADSPADVARIAAELGLPLMAKTRRLGYDGKGQAVLRTAADVAACWSRLGGVPLLLEKWIAFDREVSIVACRGLDGEVRAYPLVENVHEGGILRRTTAPASGIRAEVWAQAEQAAGRVLESLGYVGVLAIEFFEAGGTLLANEMAPRVHNSGHWTIEGAGCSQFENHCRAVAGLPLGDTRARGPAVMVNLIGHMPEARDVLAVPGAHLHAYGKAVRPGRKVGHITLTGADPAALAACASELERLSPRG